MAAEPVLTLPPAEAAAIAEPGRRAVVDIGSNSIRLVVFDGPPRAPFAVFNEKVMSGLGGALGGSGRLDVAGVDGALANLERFAALLKAMRIAEVEVVATAAVREASDGAAFIAEVKRRTGLVAKVLSGAEEAALSALGVIAGVPEAEGVIGDLGGGSLELARIGGGGSQAQATLPLGPLRLPRPPAKATARIDDALAEVAWLTSATGCTLYLVGGSWRALARIHMAQAGYPLHIIHRYTIRRGDALSLTDLVARQSPESLRAMPGVPARRLDVLPLASLVLNRLLRHLRPKAVEFSAHGLREGLLHAGLSPRARAEDPLLVACREAGGRAARFPGLAAAQSKWTSRLAADESAGEARLRQAACLLGDISWRVHPDYRAEDAFRQVIGHPGLQVAHGERIFLALAAFGRYTARQGAETFAPIVGLLAPEAAARARVLGLAARLGETVSGGVAEVLDRFTLTAEHGHGRLRLGHAAADAALLGEVVLKRFHTLAAAMSLSPTIEVG